MAKKPTTVEELFEFYYERFKPLYCHVQTINSPPLEMFFEINAAFDHLSRMWKYQESEESVVASASAHLKRGCFDAFKIILKETRDQYDTLQKVNLSRIDDGLFEGRMLSLFAHIKADAIAARAAEGDSRDDASWNVAFDLWEKVYVNCVRFEKDFFLSTKIERTRKQESRKGEKAQWGIWVATFPALFIGLVAGAIFLGQIFDDISIPTVFLGIIGATIGFLLCLLEYSRFVKSKRKEKEAFENLHRPTVDSIDEKGDC